MKVQLISASSLDGRENAFKSLCGLYGNMSIGSVIFFDFSGNRDESIYDANKDHLEQMQKDDPSFSFEFRRGEFRTSSFSNIDRKEVSRFCYEYTVTTRNSVYVFREGEESEEAPYSETEILDMQIGLGMHLF
jgi:hypothetical protein